MPGRALLFLGIYWLTRSYVAALVVAAAVALGSIWSNVRFRTVGEQGRPGSEKSTVEVMEVEATRVVGIEHLGRHDPAYCFFTSDGTALLRNGDIEVFRAQPQTLQQDLENAFGRGAG